MFSLILFALILTKRAKSNLPAFLGTAILTSSLLSITLSSEIRGYSFAASAALLAFFLHYSNNNPIGIIGFNLICCIGFVSHATFILFFAAMGIADFLLLLNTSTTEKRRRVFILLCEHYVGPSLSLIVHYIIFYRYLPPVSAPFTPWLDTVASTLSLSIGGPWISIISRPIYIVVWLYAGAGSWLLIQSLRHTVIFRPHRLHLVLIIVITPLLAILILTPQAIAERYLYLPVIFSLLPIAEFLSTLIFSCGWRKCIGMTLTTFILSGNVIHSAYFLLYENGRMRELINYCQNHRENPDSPLMITGDHYLRIGLPLKRLAAESPDIKIHYSELAAEQNNKISADWIISHYVDRAYSPPLQWKSPHGETFYLVKNFPNYSLNSWPLFLYRKSTAGKLEPVRR
jgi:hypothetical protein